MTRTSAFALCILFFSIAVSAQTPSGTTTPVPRHLDPTVVSLGKELPRGDVVSHDSRAEAVRRTPGASRYLQPLTGWTTTETAEAVTFRGGFKVPFEWIDREQFLCLGRVSGSFDVTVNGRPAGYSQTGSTPSEFDITSLAREGANDLEIIVYKDPVARRLEGSRPPAAPAIEGEVYILSQPRMRVRDVAISTRMEGTGGLLELGVIMKSHRLNPHDYTVYYELLNPAGEILAEGNKTARLDMRREDTVRFFANIPRVTPWSHEEPRLYTLLIKTQNEGRFREYLSFRVGFRSIDLAGDGSLTLNGVPLSLSMREFTPSGDMTAMRAAIEQLRSQGVNGLILDGAPPGREFYALCDEMGVYLSCRADIDTHLAGDSRTRGGNPSNDPAWRGAYLDRTMAMYHTSGNHPSAAMFALAAESANGYNLYESYLALKTVERHRPVLYIEGGEWNSDRLDPASVSSSSVGAAPAAREWVTLEATDLSRGQFRVGNSRRFTPLSGEAFYRILVGRRVVSSGSLPVEVLPGGTREFTVPITGVKEGKSYTVSVEIAVERIDGDYLPRPQAASAASGKGWRTPGETPPVRDPDLKVFRRLDQPLGEEARTVVAKGDFKSN
jgi:beta-galactosidase